MLLLTRSHPKPKPQPKGPSRPTPVGASAGVQDAFAFAKELESRLRGDPKFAKVYVVPSAATANQKAGKVVVQGDIASEADMRELQATIAKGGIPVTLEWQVTVQHPADAPPIK